MKEHIAIQYTKELSHKECDELFKILRITVWKSQWRYFPLEVKQSHIRSSVTNTFKSQMERLVEYLEKNIITKNYDNV